MTYTNTYIIQVRDNALERKRMAKKRMISMIIQNAEGNTQHRHPIFRYFLAFYEHLAHEVVQHTTQHPKTPTERPHARFSFSYNNNAVAWTMFCHFWY